MAVVVLDPFHSLVRIARNWAPAYIRGQSYIIVWPVQSSIAIGFFVASATRANAPGKRLTAGTSCTHTHMLSSYVTRGLTSFPVMFKTEAVVCFTTALTLSLTTSASLLHSWIILTAEHSQPYY